MTGMRLVATAILGVAMMASAPMAQPSTAPAAWVVIVDDLHFNFRNTGRLRDLVRRVLAEVVRPDDLVALRVSGPSTAGGDPGSPDFHRAQVSRVTGNALREDDLLRDEPATRAEIDARFRRAMSALGHAIDAFESAGDAPRGVVLISNGYARDVLLTAEGQALVDKAIRNSVKMFAISGRYIASSDLDLPPAVDENAWAAHLEAERYSLRDLAERTGGFAIFTAQELPAALQRIRVE